MAAQPRLEPERNRRGIMAGSYPRQVWVELTAAGGSPFLAIAVGRETPTMLRFTSTETGNVRQHVLPMVKDLNENNRHFFAEFASANDQVMVSVVAEGHLFGPTPLPVEVDPSNGSLKGSGKRRQLSIPLHVDDQLIGKENLPVDLEFNVQWLGAGATRETGRFGYIVLDKRGLSNLNVLPNPQSGVVHVDDEGIVARHQEAFMIYDTDGSGTLNLEEYRVYLTEMERNPYDQENLDLLARFDRGGRGELTFVDFCRLAGHLGEQRTVLPFRALISSTERYVYPDGATFVRVSDRQDHLGKGGFVAVESDGQRILQTLNRPWTRKEAVVRVQRFVRAVNMLYWIKTRLAACCVIVPFLKAKAGKLIYQRIRNFARLNDSAYCGYEHLPEEVGQVSRARMRETVAKQLCYGGWGYYEPFKLPLSKYARMKARQAKEAAEAEKKEFMRHMDAEGEAEVVDEALDDGADLSWVKLKGTYPEPYHDGTMTLYFKHNREYWKRLLEKGTTRALRLNRWWKGTVAYEGGGMYLEKRQEFLKKAYKLIDSAQNREEANAAILAIYVLLVTQRKIRLLMHYGHLRSIKAIWDLTMERISGEEDETLQDDFEEIDEAANHFLERLEEEEAMDAALQAAMAEESVTGVSEYEEGVTGVSEYEEGETEYSEYEEGETEYSEYEEETEVEERVTEFEGIAEGEEGEEEEKEEEPKQEQEEAEVGEAEAEGVAGEGEPEGEATGEGGAKEEEAPEGETEMEPERETEVPTEAPTEAEEGESYAAEYEGLESATPGLLGLKERKAEELRKARMVSKLYFQCLASSIDPTKNSMPSGNQTPLNGVVAQATNLELVSPWQVAYGFRLFEADFLPEIVDVSDLPQTGATLFKGLWQYIGDEAGGEAVIGVRTRIPPCLPKWQSLNMAAIALTVGEKSVSYVSSADGSEVAIPNRRSRLAAAREAAKRAAAERKADGS